MNMNIVKIVVMATALALAMGRQETVRADLPAPRSEAKPVVATESLPSVVEPVVDPMEQSRKIRANLEMWPQRVHRRLMEAEQRLKGIDLREIQGQVLLAQDFEEILADLDEEAAAIQDAFGKITTDLKLYQEAVAQAPASFRAVAAAFEKKASDCDDPVLKGHYADFATTSLSMAARYEEKHKFLVALERDLEAKLKFVARSRAFIGDVKSFLSTIPKTEEGIAVESFVKRLNAYVNVFQDSIKMLKGLSDQIGKEPVSPSSKEAPKLNSTPVPAVSRPLKASEFRSRLADLKSAP